jgi:hypothetical protein
MRWLVAAASPAATTLASLNVQRLSVGPHGVWAATDGSVVQLATS